MKENSFVNKVINKIKNNKILPFIIVAVLVIGFVFAYFSDKKTQTTISSSSDLEIYSNELKTKLENILKRVDGVGDISVEITFECGYETVIAYKTTVTENINGKETVTSPILVNGKTVKLKDNNPKIQGVLIVCKGASNINVLNKVLNSTSSFLDVEKDKIEILNMK